MIPEIEFVTSLKQLNWSLKTKHSFKKLTKTAQILRQKRPTKRLKRSKKKKKKSQGRKRTKRSEN